MNRNVKCSIEVQPRYSTQLPYKLTWKHLLITATVRQFHPCPAWYYWYLGGVYMRHALKGMCLLALVGFSGLFSFHANVQAQKDVMGQLQLTATTKVAKTSGVWIDGQYVGFLNELKGGNRLKLLPG